MRTNIDEWRTVAVGSQPAWEGRARIIAKLIRSTDTVLDIGAGDQKLKKFIPSGCAYVPIDCVDDLPGTFLVDFNKEFRLPDIPFTVAVCAGSLEYINNLAGFFRDFAEQAPGKQIIFTYLLDDQKSRRNLMKVHNHFTTADALLSEISFALSHIDIVAMRKGVVYVTATLSIGGNQWVNTAPITDFLLDEALKERGIHRFFAKISRSVRKRMNPPL